MAKIVSLEQIENQKILISKPEYDWEKVGNPLVNAAPQVIIKDNTINLVYSASGNWNRSVRIQPILSSEYYQPIAINTDLDIGDHTLEIKSQICVDTISLEKIELIKVN